MAGRAGVHAQGDEPIDVRQRRIPRAASRPRECQRAQGLASRLRRDRLLQHPAIELDLRGRKPEAELAQHAPPQGLEGHPGPVTRHAVRQREELGRDPTHVPSEARHQTIRSKSCGAVRARVVAQSHALLHRLAERCRVVRGAHPPQVLPRRDDLRIRRQCATQRRPGLGPRMPVQQSEVDQRVAVAEPPRPVLRVPARHLIQQAQAGGRGAVGREPGVDQKAIALREVGADPR